MRLQTMKDMLIKARAGRYAVGAFEVWSLDSIQAVLEAAQEERMPVILQVGSLEAEFSGIRNLARMAREAAEMADIPVALHLDHAETIELVKQALDAGFTSVMIDASRKSFSENAAIVRKTVAEAGLYGVTVEAELGRLAGSEAHVENMESMFTDPGEARLFVEETGIDALAISIGTAHGFYRFKPEISIERLAGIAREVSIPLVLHGGSGTPDESVVAAINHGIAKVNICTEFIAAMGRAYTDAQRSDTFRYNVISLFGRGKAAGKELAARKIRLFANREPV